VRITARSAVIGVGVVVAAVVAQRVFVAAHRPLSWAAAAVVVAVLIDPVVDVLDRHMPRILAVILTLVVFAGAVYGVVYVAFDDLADGVDRFGEAAEEAVDRLEARDDSVGDTARDVDASRRCSSSWTRSRSAPPGGRSSSPRRPAPSPRTSWAGS
jgi:predicted PurR-regulated permease PerM